MIFQGVPLWIHPCQTYEYCCPVLSGSCIHLSFKYYAAISFNSLCLLGNFFMLFAVCRFFSKSAFTKNSFRNTIRVSNSLDQDQARHFVRRDLGPNCLQRLPPDDTTQVGKEMFITTLPCPICNQHLSDISITTMLSNTGTVLPAMSDSDVMFCLQLFKTLTCTVHFSLCESIDHSCINPILRIGLIHKWSINYK